MNADKRRCLSAADSSAFIRVHQRSVKAVFPGKNPGKLLAGYLRCPLSYVLRPASGAQVLTAREQMSKIDGEVTQTGADVHKAQRHVTD